MIWSLVYKHVETSQITQFASGVAGLVGDKLKPMLQRQNVAILTPCEGGDQVFDSEVGQSKALKAPAGFKKLSLAASGMEAYQAALTGLPVQQTASSGPAPLLLALMVFDAAAQELPLPSRGPTPAIQTAAGLAKTSNHVAQRPPLPSSHLVRDLPCLHRLQLRRPSPPSPPFLRPLTQLSLLRWRQRRHPPHPSLPSLPAQFDLAAPAQTVSSPSPIFSFPAASVQSPSASAAIATANEFPFPGPAPFGLSTPAMHSFFTPTGQAAVSESAAWAEQRPFSMVLALLGGKS